MYSGVWSPVWKSSWGSRVYVHSKRDRGKKWACPATTVERDAEGVGYGKAADRKRRAGERAKGESPLLGRALGGDPVRGRHEDCAQRGCLPLLLYLL